MYIDDWRSAQGQFQLPQESREKIVNNIMEMLKRHLDFSGEEELQELEKIAVRFEGKNYTAATSQSDYLRKVSLKMLTMETESQNPMAPQDPASQSMQLQIQNPVQQLPITMLSNQAQVPQQILSQNIQNNIASTGVPNSAGLASALAPVGGMSQGTMPNVPVQNPNMQNMSNVTLNTVGNLMGQGVTTNMYANSQKQIQGRQQQVVLQDSQQQAQNLHQYLYNQQLQQLMLQQSKVAVQQQMQQNMANMMPNQAQPSQSQPMQQLQHLLQYLYNRQLQQHLMLQQSMVAVQQLMQQNMTNMIPNQAQQSQSQPMQQQLMSQIQSQPGQMQQQLGLQQQANTLPRDMQQRIQTSGPMLQQQTTIDQQKQLLQSQRVMPEVPLSSLDSSSQTGSASGGDWQEEIYQKIKSMHEMYYPELNEMYQKMVAKLQQQDALPQQPKNEQFEKLRFLKLMSERLIMFLRTNKNDIQPDHKEKIVGVEKQIVNILKSNRPRKPVSSLQQGQLNLPHMHAMQKSQQQQPQMHTNEGQMNSQMQPMNMLGSMMPTQQNSLTNLLQYQQQQMQQQFLHRQQLILQQQQQQQQQTLLQPNQLQSSQPAVMQSSSTTQNQQTSLQQSLQSMHL